MQSSSREKRGCVVAISQPDIKERIANIYVSAATHNFQNGTFVLSFVGVLPRPVLLSVVMSWPLALYGCLMGRASRASRRTQRCGLPSLLSKVILRVWAKSL